MSILRFLLVFALLLAAYAEVQATTTGSAGSSSSAGGGGPNPQSNPALPIPAPTSTIISDFRSFYIVVDGGEPIFQVYATELIAEAVGDALLPAPKTSPPAAPTPPPFYVVAAAGWTEDTLNAACKNDVNAMGGLIVKFVSFFVQSNWIVYTNERDHVQVQLIYVSCANQVAAHVSPAIAFHTITSAAHQFTVPIAPITGLSTLFTFHDSMSTTGVFQVKWGVLLLATALGGLSGNVGYLNPGHEVLDVARRLSPIAVDFTRIVCDEDVTTDVVSKPSATVLRTLLAGEARNWANPSFTKPWLPSPSPPGFVPVPPLKTLCGSLFPTIM